MAPAAICSCSYTDPVTARGILIMVIEVVPKIIIRVQSVQSTWTKKVKAIGQKVKELQDRVYAIRWSLSGENITTKNEESSNEVNHQGCEGYTAGNQGPAQVGSGFLICKLIRSDLLQHREDDKRRVYHPKIMVTRDTIRILANAKMPSYLKVLLLLPPLNDYVMHGVQINCLTFENFRTWLFVNLSRKTLKESHWITGMLDDRRRSNKQWQSWAQFVHEGRPWVEFLYLS